MTEKCYDSGTIQAFLDGELASDVSQKLTRHIALCDRCAGALGEAEDETAFAFAALEREYDTLVPTHRLWSKINDSIAADRKQSSVWQRLLASVSVLISNPSMTVAAGVLIIFGIFGVFLTLQNNPTVSDVANVENQPTLNDSRKIDSTVPSAEVSPTNPPRVLTASTENEDTNEEAKAPKVYAAAKRETAQQNNLKIAVVNAAYTENQKPKTKDQKPKTETFAYLPGEESYVKTIANLSETVNSRKDEILRPSAQIALARDLAVVDDAIVKMKKEVRKNPKNESAKQVLYASYQNKIDLLNSVAEKNELMASLK